jgi:tetratricopeptide (TPR) repeat protein
MPTDQPWWSAYAADRAIRDSTRALAEPRDDGWLALAALLHARAHGDQATATALSGGTMSADDPATVAAIRAVRALDTSEVPGVRREAVVSEAVAAVAAVAADMEREGAFHLAGALLRDMQIGCASELPGRDEAALLWQRARAARQAGDLDAASDGYVAAADSARRARATGLLARALVGRANVANMRGNYPAARTAYMEALRLVEGQPELAVHARSAHQGLALAAIAARDLDAAIVHGWRAYTASSGPDDEAQALLNVAETCRLAGDAAASLRAALLVVERATVSRLRMPALGTAAHAAGRLGRVPLVRALRARVAREIAGAGPYEHAHTLVEFAEAWAHLDRRVEATRDARDALAMAETLGFHEVTIRGDGVLDAVAAGARTVTSVERPPARRWSAPARRALAGVRALPDSALAGV